MTSEQLASIAGVALSLAFSYIPGLREQFERLTSGYKQLVMGALILIVSAVVFGLACAEVLESVRCTRDGALGLLFLAIEALIANQSAYLITRRRE
jgi:hypothetical protein